MPSASLAKEIAELTAVLQAMPKPRGKQLKFLRAHARARGRAMNMRTIAEKADYKSYRGANLQYGLLADRIGRRLSPPRQGFGILVDAVPPKGRRNAEHVTNDEYVLIMRPAFAEALENAGWI